MKYKLIALIFLASMFFLMALGIVDIFSMSLSLLSKTNVVTADRLLVSALMAGCALLIMFWPFSKRTAAFVNHQQTPNRAQEVDILNLKVSTSVPTLAQFQLRQSYLETPTADRFDALVAFLSARIESPIPSLYEVDIETIQKIQTIVESAIDWPESLLDDDSADEWPEDLPSDGTEKVNIN